MLFMYMLCLQRNGPSVFMFGFMSLVFTMRERVESSMEMVSEGIAEPALYYFMKGLLCATF